MGSLTFAGGRALMSGAPVVTAPPFTVAGWVRPTNVSVFNQLFYLGNAAAAATDQFRLAITSSGEVSCVTLASGGSGQALARNPLANATWAHCAGVWTSAAQRRAIANGDLVNARSNTANLTPPTPTFLVLGAQRQGNGYSAELDGQAENWAVWNEPLTDGEVVALSQGTQPCDVRPHALVHWWRSFGRYGSSSTIVDWMGAGDLGVTLATVSNESPPQRGRMSRRRNLFWPAAAAGAVARPWVVMAGL